MSVPKNINAWLAVNTNLQTVKTQQTQIRKVCARHSEHCELPPTDNVQNTICFYKVCSDENIAFQCIFLKAKATQL